MLKLTKVEVWLGPLVAAVPGLTVFLTGWGAPTDLRPKFAVVLEVAAFATLAVLLVRREEIQKWAKVRVARQLIRTAGGAVILLLLFTIVHGVTVHPTYYASGRAEYVLIPVPVRFWADAEVQYFAACSHETDMTACAMPDANVRTTVTDVARAITRFGEAVTVPREWLWAIELTILVALYSMIIVTLIWLYGIAMIRRLDVAAFVKEYAAAPETNGTGE